MTTTELEKRLKISEKTCIHCPTLELAKQVLNIFHQLGLRWRNETHYITYTNWDKYKENTIYFPFNRDFSSLEFAHLTGFKILNAEEFIALHTKFDLENYIPKGDLKGFPKEIIARMLNYQEEQWGKIDISVFEKDRTAGEPTKGFVWSKTKEGYDFWNEVIRFKNFALFFEKYPKKQEDSEEFIALHTENEKNMTTKEKIEELESRIQVLQNAIMNGGKLKPKTALKKKDEIEYYLFTDEAKRRLSRKNMNCAPFTIVEKYGNVVTTSNGDTINTYWIYCINSDTPKYTPAPPKGKCCYCNCCRK